MDNLYVELLSNLRFWKVEQLLLKKLSYKLSN